MAKVPFDQWQVESFRLTFFPTPEYTFKPEEFWQNVVGTEPDNISSVPKRGLTSVYGPYAAARLVVRGTFDRIDAIFIPPETKVDGVNIIVEDPFAAPIEEVLDSFSALAKNWVNTGDISEVVRVAFGGIFTRPTPNQAEANKELMEYLPIDIDPQSSDLFFQINPPPVRSNVIDELAYNHLSKWMIIRQTRITSTFSGDKLFRTIEEGLGISIRLEVDVNSVPSFPGSIKKNQLFDVYNELVQEATNIVSTGVKGK
jgi:hypothetical protein